MNVLMAHCYYRERGGEDASFEAESRLLAGHGHRLLAYVRRNHEIDGYGPLDMLGLALRTVRADDAYRALRRLAAAERPEIAHFQNTFPLISPGAYDACHRAGVPVVQSLRNYRLLCPNAVFYRDGRVCEDCLGRRVPWPGVVHACYRDSRVATAVVAGMLSVHNAARTWHTKVDLYVALTQFARTKFTQAGLPAARVFVKPNFVNDPGDGGPVPVGGAVLFVGRLSREKGIEDLLRAAARLRPARALRIVGDGPDRARLEAIAIECGLGPSIFLGELKSPEVYGEMRRAVCLVVPSRWYETFGRVIIESFGCGRPVLVPRHGALAELVQDDRTGTFFEPGNPESLAEALARVLGDGTALQRMGREGRREYESKYTPELNYRMIMGIYRRALELTDRPIPEAVKRFPPADAERSPFEWIVDRV